MHKDNSIHHTNLLVVFFYMKKNTNPVRTPGSLFKVWKNLRTLILHWKQDLMKNLTWEIDSPRRLGMSRYQFCCKTPVGHASMDDKVISRFWTISWKKWFKSYILTARCVVRKYFCFHFRSQKVISFPTSYWAQGSNKPSRRTSDRIFFLIK